MSEYTLDIMNSTKPGQEPNEHETTPTTMDKPPNETVQSAGTTKRPILDKASSRLLLLPAELRVMVWEYALTSADRVTPPDQSFLKVKGPKVAGIQSLVSEQEDQRRSERVPLQRRNIRALTLPV